MRQQLPTPKLENEPVKFADLGMTAQDLRDRNYWFDLGCKYMKQRLWRVYVGCTALGTLLGAGGTWLWLTL